MYNLVCVYIYIDIYIHTYPLICTTYTSDLALRQYATHADGFTWTWDFGARRIGGDRSTVAMASSVEVMPGGSQWGTQLGHLTTDINQVGLGLLGLYKCPN